MAKYFSRVGLVKQDFLISLTLVEANSNGKIGNTDFTIAWKRGPETSISKVYKFTN